MNDTSSGGISFSNAGFVPSDDEDILLTEFQSSTQCELFEFSNNVKKSPMQNHRSKRNERCSSRPLLASTPRVICRIRKSDSNRDIPCFAKEPSFQPVPEFMEMSETLHDIAENSQGYRFFSTHTPFQTHHSRRFKISNVSDIPRRLIDKLTSTVQSFRFPESIQRNLIEGEQQLDIEVARDEGELINLSDIYREDKEDKESFSSISFGSAGDNPIYPSSEVFQSTAFSNRSTYSNKKMGSLHRSERMKLFQLILVKEAAFDCVAEIGKHGNVQFLDLNAKLSTYARTFVKQTRRCEEMERKLRFLEKQVITCKPELEPKPINFDDLSAASQTEMVQLEQRLDQLEREFLDLNHNDHELRKHLNSAKEFFQCITMVTDFFQVHKDEDTKARLERSATTDDIELFSRSFGFGGLSTTNDVPLTPLLKPNDNAWFVAGVLPWDKKASFERVLWRACRRTAFVRTSENYFTVTDPVTLEPNQKCCFIVFFKGESLRQIVAKVCDGFNAIQYPCPKTTKERKTKKTDLEGRINDLTVVIDTTQTHRYTILKDLSYDLPGWLKCIQIQKSVFHVMNMFTVDTNGFLAGECWIPVAEEENVRKALHLGFRASGTEVEPILNEMITNASPPTLHRTNKFTNVFQSIVDSYGVSQYREVNPAPYTIITFPFLFAVMFGDAAHGLILLCASLYFVFNEEKIQKRKIRDEIFNTFFGGRYIMMLMGIFSIYTGIMYNDAFAKSVNVFGSAWSNPYNETTVDWWVKRSVRKKREFNLELVPENAFDYENGPYMFGVDPIWNIAENRLVFLNSMKMKASVIIGISQMTFGVFLSVLNHVHFKSYIDILTNFIPQLIFLFCIFVYLCVQIVVKWIFFSVDATNVLGFEYPGSHCAPSLLIGLINMFMFKKRKEGYYDDNGEIYPNCHLNYWYPHQRTVETLLFIIAVTCVPIMLLGKPLYTKFVLTKRNKKQREPRVPSSRVLKRNVGSVLASPENEHQEIDELLVPDDLDLSDEVHHSMMDVVVHQAIHTIEFVLGCVSHTASYLRLWALSLAHAQLSEVMWHMVLIQGINLADNISPYLAPLVVCTSFFIFAILSLSILIMMEGLSAFLHALRLHWVEFQSKFYQGTGHPFHAFYLLECLETAQNITEETDRLADISRGK